MKTILICTCLCFGNLIQAQEIQKSKDKPVSYRAKIEKQRGGSLGGVVTGITDSTITLSRLKVPLSFSQIKKIKFMKAGQAKKGMLLGAISGALFGAFIGFASGDDSKNTILGFSAGEKAILSGTLFSAVGVLIGELIGGAALSKFEINGDREYFQTMREVMRYQLPLK